MCLERKSIRWCLALMCLVLLCFVWVGRAGAAEPELVVTRQMNIANQYQGFAYPLDFTVKVYDADLSSPLPVTIRIGGESISADMRQESIDMVFPVEKLNSLMPGAYTIYLRTNGNTSNTAYETTVGTVTVEKRFPLFRGNLEILVAVPGALGEQTLGMYLENVVVVDEVHPLHLTLTLQDLSSLTTLREVEGFSLETLATSITEEILWVLPAEVLDGLPAGSYAPRVSTPGNAYTEAQAQQVGLIVVLDVDEPDVTREPGTPPDPTETPVPATEPPPRPEETPVPATPPPPAPDETPAPQETPVPEVTPAPVETPPANGGGTGEGERNTPKATEVPEGDAYPTPYASTPEDAQPGQPVLDLGQGVSMTLEELQEKSRIDGAVPVWLPERVGGTSATLPVSVLQALGAPVMLRTSYGSYVIPPSLISGIPGLDRQLAALGLSPEEVGLSVRIEPVVPTPGLLKDLAGRLPGRQLLGLPVDFSLALVGPSGEDLGITPASFSVPVRRYLPLTQGPGSEIPERWAAFRYNPGNGAFDTVAQQLVNLDGEWNVAIDSYSNSIYLLTRREVVLADVSKEDLAYPYISRAVSKALMDTTAEDCFEPDEPICRAEFVQLFTNILYLPESMAPHPYTDVTSDSGFDEAVGQAYAAGWLSQLAPGETFDPYLCITREEALGVLLSILKQYNAVGEPMATEELIRQYSDYWDLAPQYLTALSFVQPTGILPLQEEGWLLPTECVTRGQAAEILIKTLVAVGYLDE